jgi:hypothetical protein
VAAGRAAAPQEPGGWKGALSGPSDPLTDLGLTLPIFVGYHLGVVLLDKINAADFVTAKLVLLSERSVLGYWALTLGGGAALVLVLLALGRGKRLSWWRFATVAVEGVLYATLMKLAAVYVVGSLHLGPSAGGFFEGMVMSFGAGFYEELAFRVVLFGLGARLLTWLFPARKLLVLVVWALITSCAFSAWHYLGPEAFRMDSFVFRWVCGLCFVVIYRLRGFAPAVWTHALYDVWVLAL